MGKRKNDIPYKEQTVNICPCGIKSQPPSSPSFRLRDTVTWANLGGHMVLLCWDCTDKLHKNTIEEGEE